MSVVLDECLKVLAKCRLSGDEVSYECQLTCVGQCESRPAVSQCMGR